MATDYPDVIGEYIFAPKRLEVDGLQYVGVFSPPTVAPGETAQLRLYLQNTLNVPLKIEIRSTVPQTGRFKAQPLLNLGAPQINVDMGEAEVGLLTIPVATTAQTFAGEHALIMDIKVQHSKNATQIRRPKPKDPLRAIPLDSPVGLNLVGVVGTTYNLINGKKARFTLAVSGDMAEASPTTGLAHHYQKLWDLDEAEAQQKAQLEVNRAKAEILQDMAVEPLFVSLYVEVQRRFADAGLPLRIGEAIALAKLLTFTAHLFLSQPELQDGLLCPIWERALFNKYPTANISLLVKEVGFRHILRLSISLSFGLIAQVHGAHLWSDEERTGVSAYLTEALEEGTSLELDFLYLPLMMGALRIIRKVTLADEDVDQTLQLIWQARSMRSELFADEEMADAARLLETVLQQAMMK